MKISYFSVFFALERDKKNLKLKIKTTYNSFRFSILKTTNFKTVL